jgi:ADP-L-glycero-D-manno-heptose 6-epimerase
MILITGGAGFIGSTLQAALQARDTETLVSDWLGGDAKWRNLAAHPPSQLVDPDRLDDFLDGHPPLEAIFHMGAISDTMATDADAVWRTNVSLSQRLWDWCANRGVRFIYASSAATYGDGAQGFDDDPAGLLGLRPLNLYGWSKQVFDLWVLDMLRRGAPRPPQWAGLKFFNVYGPNEYHKGRMISVVHTKYQEILAGRKPTLFRATTPDLADGAQARDFIHVDDAVGIMLWLLDHPAVSGVFNAGTGAARTYLDLAHAVCDAAGAPRAIEFIDMPARLQPQYQNFTQARIDRLRGAGYTAPFIELEDGVARYIKDYLSQPNPYR